MEEDAPPDETRTETHLEPVDPAGETVPAPAALGPGAPLAVEPGARLGRYEIVGGLGMGGMGVVFEARDTELDRIVALKLVRARVGDLAIAQARLRREAQAMARLSHPNVAAVFDIGALDERLFIAMELVRGGTLRDHVGRGRAWRDELRTVIDAGRGLAAAHEAGVIHRDFKPDNVLVRTDGTVRVADFGLSREAADPADLTATAAPAQTAGVGGTLGYMAPESFDGAAGAATDQFAFAVTAFEVLEGHRPFEGGGSLEAHLRALRGGRRRPWRRREVPARVRAAIDRGLALDPAARWPSMSALCDALAPRKPRALGWALALVLVLVVAAAVGIAVVGSRSPGPAQPPPPSFNEAARQQLTFSGDASLPTLSSDGRWLAYGIGYEPRSVAVQDLTTGRSRVVYHDMPVMKIRWSHDGTRLLLGTRGGNVLIDRNGTPRMSIPGCYLSAWAPDDARVVTICAPESGLDFFDLATRTRRDVAATFDATQVVGIDWSRRDRLAVVTHGRAGFQVWTLRPDGTDLREVASEATSRSVSLIRWSADGDAIFYERVRDQSAELVRLEIEPRSGTSDRAAVLLTTLAADRGFSLAGDGRSVAYAREARTANLARWSADGAPRALTADTREKRTLVLSRDRRRVAYVAGAGERKQILVAPQDGANGAPIPNVAADILDLDWSPDGTHLAYSARRDGVVELWTVDAKTGEIRKLVHSTVSPHGDIAWASPGELLYLTPGTVYRVLDLATGRERELSPRIPNHGRMVYPQISPDGRWIAVVVLGAPDAAGTWSISLEDGSARQLYHDILYPIGWSEDGAWVYAQNAGFTMTYAISASGSGEIRSLLASPRPARWVQILPGERAALALEWVWQSDIWRIDLDGAAPPNAFAPPEPYPAPPVLPSLINGDMSRGVVGRAPDGWSRSPYGGTAELTDRCHGASDRCATVSHGGWLEQRVTADAYRGRRIRVRVRAQVTGSSTLGLRLETPTEATILNIVDSTDAVGWQTLEIVADIRPDARHLAIRTTTSEASSALFDDVSLEILDR